MSGYSLAVLTPITNEIDRDIHVCVCVPFAVCYAVLKPKE